MGYFEVRTITTAMQHNVTPTLLTIIILQSLCLDTQSANLLINSSLMTLIVRQLKNTKSNSLRARLAHVAGLLIRWATYISDNVRYEAESWAVLIFYYCSKSGIVTTLADLLRERDEKVRRRVIAALGEILFYAATQDDESVRFAFFFQEKKKEKEICKTGEIYV